MRRAVVVALTSALIVLVSHALQSVRNLCDDVALLEHGHLRATGPANEVIETYLGEVHEDRTEEDRVDRASTRARRRSGAE